MNVIIIEDEKPAAKKLWQDIVETDDSVNILAVLTSVQASLEWLNKNSMPELIFMDIELTDGLSFVIFNERPITCPVIFTTAYDEYWQEAFEHNCIDYLLKPVKKEKLRAALKKYDILKQHFAANLKQLLQWNKLEKPGYKKRFLVRRGTDLVSVKSEDIAYFYATHKLVCLVTSTDQKYILDKSLADIEKDTDPLQFFRLNRKYLVNVNAIQRMRSHQKGKLLVEIFPAVNEPVVISQENTAAFKGWIES